jgi:hypothetical protein
MQEASGTRYDATGNGRHALDSTVGSLSAPGQNTGHVQQKAADFERGSGHGLEIPDASWQHGDRSWSMGGWFYLESAEWIFMCKGGAYDYGNWVCWHGASNYGYFGVGTTGAEYWNSSFRAYDTVALSTSTWYFYLARWSASANTGYIYIYNTSGTLVATDSTIQMDMGANDSPFGITFGSTGDASYPYLPADSGPVSGADGRLEQWFLYDGLLSAAEITWLVNGGVGRTWRDFQDPRGMPTIF